MLNKTLWQCDVAKRDYGCAGTISITALRLDLSHGSQNVKHRLVAVSRFIIHG